MKRITFLSVLFFTGYSLNAQIGMNTSTPSSKAELDIVSPTKNKGVLIPRMQTTERIAIAPGTDSQVKGLTVYDTDTRSFWEWNGEKWIEIDPIGKYIAEQGLDPYDIAYSLLLQLGYFYKDPYDGHVYKSLKIGNRVWFAENFIGTKYNDGTAIPPAQTFNSYGYMMYLDIFSSGKSVCPVGWHIANESDWTDLITTLGGYNQTTCDKLRLEASTQPGTWGYDSYGCPGNNSSKFGALQYTLFFSEYWCFDYMPPKQMYLNCTTIYLHVAAFNPGFVRCVKN
jgi:uncharacterized protein (TIGR02145 family)